MIYFSELIALFEKYWKTQDQYENDLDENPEDEDEDIDPLVKALRQSDDNEDYYNED